MRRTMVAGVVLAALGGLVPEAKAGFAFDSSVYASYAYASAEKLSDAVTSVPTPWGKTTPLWQDYIAGTDPDPKGTNATLRIIGFSVVDGAPVIRYSPDLGEKRRYTVLGRESLDDEAGWHERREGDRFFKVKVEMP